MKSQELFYDYKNPVLFNQFHILGNAIIESRTSPNLDGAEGDLFTQFKGRLVSIRLESPPGSSHIRLLVQQ